MGYNVRLRLGIESIFLMHQAATSCCMLALPASNPPCATLLKRPSVQPGFPVWERRCFLLLPVFVAYASEYVQYFALLLVYVQEFQFVKKLLMPAAMPKDMSWLSPKRRRTTGNLKTLPNGQVNSDATNGSAPPGSPVVVRPPSAHRPISQPVVSTVNNTGDGNLFYAYARKVNQAEGLL